MTDISNFGIYLKRMAATLKDKCWWVDRLPPNIDTVVDYGCAQGDLAAYLERNHPGRFRYIGIDNSPAMLALVEQHRDRLFGAMPVAFYPTISGIADRCDVGRAVLVLNSVLHEVFSYLSAPEQAALLDGLYGSGFRFIAIRDMFMPRLDPLPFDVDAALRAIKKSPFAELWEDYSACLDAADRDPCWSSTPLRVSEFLLKYTYTDNWSREKLETYFWDWLQLTDEARRKGGYEVIADIPFHIPFLRQQIRADFGINLPIDTHRKVLLRKG